MGLAALNGRSRTNNGAPFEAVFELFPALRELRGRKGGDLSGGQQQLAIARALIAQPRFLLLDEPMEGLQPSIVLDIEQALRRIRREMGVTVLLVEQHLELAWGFADRYYVMQKGRVVETGNTREPAVVTRQILCCSWSSLHGRVRPIWLNNFARLRLQLFALLNWKTDVFWSR